ncbi:MAG: cell division protein SepF [Segniliparus sp.]|uniref:cell division protein SepF n=1 Tax=Segniliparus sp. TaxID=2804064 RepID=UPI003F2DF6A3
MSALQKVKAYFGMMPADAYEDEYLEDDRQPGARTRRYREEYADYETGYEWGHLPQAGEYEPPIPGRGASRAVVGTLTARRGHDRYDVDYRRPAGYEEAGALSKITTLRPKDYSEARTIGERFRDGSPVIMDLVQMDNADAKRLVDFAAGLAFALRGSFDKVATKVFLLSPADVDVSPEERRRIAEAGFYNHR